ncbi:MAG: surface lipoprotein assembly modifier [Desulfobacula sp.]|nr:surface lipoprotein assembly modifier [Desulfobacula sp.]
MKKTLYLIILIWFYCYSTFTVCFADSQEYTYRTGIDLFNQKNFEPAYKIFLLIFENDPENLELNFYLGRSAFETGNYEMAVMAFERILIVSPFEQRVKLEIARSFHRLGANNIAKKYCKEVLDANPPDIVKNNIKNFLSLIDKSEQTHFIDGYLTVGVDWNNNVWASPSNKTIKTVIGDINLTGPSSAKTQDWIYNTVFGLNHTFRYPYSKNFWKTKTIFYQGLYGKTSDLDTIYISAQTGPEFNFGKNRLKTKFLMAQLQLDRDKYESTIGVLVALDHIINSGLILTTTLDYKIQDFPDNSLKDSTDKSITFEAHFPYRKNWFGIGSRVQEESAFDDEYSYNKYSAFITASREFSPNTIGFFNYEYQYAGYKKAASLFSKNRMDQLHFAGCGLSKKLWQSSQDSMQNIFFNLNYQHIWAFSNISLYEYTKDLIQLSLTYNF